MATGSEYQTIPGLVAGADYRLYQYYPVRSSTTAGQVVVATAATDAVIGILQNAPNTGEAAEVACLGICKAIAGAADLNEGEPCTVNTSGVLDTTTGGNRLCGFTLQASSAVGDIVTFLVIPSVMGD